MKNICKQFGSVTQAALITFAALTFTFSGCDNSTSPNDDNGEPGHTKHRPIYADFVYSSGEVDWVYYYYNFDGSLKRINEYDSSGNITYISYYTNNTEGLITKSEGFTIDDVTGAEVPDEVYNYTYINNVLTTANGRYWDPYEEVWKYEYGNYTFVNGKKTQTVWYDAATDIPGARYSCQYDSQGRRTTTMTERYDKFADEWNYYKAATRLYGSNGLITAVLYNSPPSSTMWVIYRTFEWEPEETTYDIDAFWQY